MPPEAKKETGKCYKNMNAELFKMSKDIGKKPTGTCERYYFETKKEAGVSQNEKILILRDAMETLFCDLILLHFPVQRRKADAELVGGELFAVFLAAVLLQALPD